MNDEYADVIEIKQGMAKVSFQKGEELKVETLKVIKDGEAVSGGIVFLYPYKAQTYSVQRSEDVEHKYVKIFNNSVN